MKALICLSLPIYPPILQSKPSFSTNRDDHLIPHLSHARFTFKAQLTSLYMHPTDYPFRLYDKIQDFLQPLLQKYCLPTNIGLTMVLRSFLLIPIFFADQSTNKKRMKKILHSSPLHKKSLISKGTLNFFNKPKFITTFLLNTNKFHRSQQQIYIQLIIPDLHDIFAIMIQ